MCTASDKECVSNIYIDANVCIDPCEGIYADVTKTEANKIDEKNYGALLKSYNKYKRFFDLDDSIIMILFCMSNSRIKIVVLCNLLCYWSNMQGVA